MKGKANEIHTTRRVLEGLDHAHCVVVDACACAVTLTLTLSHSLCPLLWVGYRCFPGGRAKIVPLVHQKRPKQPTPTNTHPHTILPHILPTYLIQNGRRRTVGAPQEGQVGVRSDDQAGYRTCLPKRHPRLGQGMRIPKCSSCRSALEVSCSRSLTDARGTGFCPYILSLSLLVGYGQRRRVQERFAW
jgi:hypothetical protein